MLILHYGRPSVCTVLVMLTPRSGCRHVQPKVPGRAVEPGKRPCRLPRGFWGRANGAFEAPKRVTCTGSGRQGCGAGMCSQRSWEGLWSLANGPAGCREDFGGGQTALSKRLKSDAHRLWQARLRCRHVQPKVPGRAVEPGKRPCRLPRGFWGRANGAFETPKE